MTSFAHQIKNELVRQLLSKRCCAAAELRAFLQISGKLSLSSKMTKIILQTQSASVARRVFSLFKLCFRISPEILSCRRKQFQKNGTFILQVIGKNEVFKILQELGFMKIHPQNDKPVLVPHFNQQSVIHELKDKCCRRAFLRGAFLAGGSLSDPKTGYHLEIVAPSEPYAKAIKNVMASFRLKARYFQRKNDYVIYLKGGEGIGEFLRIIAAHNALLTFENIRVVKGVRNKINRLVNCETANLTKTVFASHEQIRNIKLIEEKIGLKKLPPSLLQAAQLRLSFPEATMQELGDLAEPPLSKSSINHRLRRINALAEKIEENGQL
ncbi:MAG: DNA-binding protein WhiA [Bacillota bacterium]|nr:DNA-binding protein WhiA [Bacillota bacterium]